MRGMPFNLQGEEGSFWSGAHNSSTSGSNSRKRKGFGGLEPRSVLDNRRSASPQTSSSTLSSSLRGGGGASSDTAGVAEISDNPAAHKWPPSSGSTTTPTSSAAAAAERRDEWASELQPIPAASSAMGVAGGDQCEMGVEEWEAMITESAASPIQEQTFLQWIMADNEDPSAAAAGLKQHLLHPEGQEEFDGNWAGGMGFGLVDQGFGFEPMGAIGGGASLSASSGGGFPVMNSGGGSVKVPSFGNQSNHPMPLALPPGVFCQESMDDRPLFFGPGMVLNQHQQSHAVPNPAFFLPMPPFSVQHETHQPPAQRHHQTIVDPTCRIPAKPPFPDSAAPGVFLRRNQPQQQGFSHPNPASYHLQQRPMKPKAAGDEAAAASVAQQQQQALVDQLFKTAELIEAGNSGSAHGILARLNQQLPSPKGKPLLRSAFYFKEALLQLTTNTSLLPAPPATLLDVVLKLGTYKAFSEVSPVVQFTNFTCIQTLLEELNGSDRIHIIDFDIGIGGQWSSFMQELAQQRCSSTASGTPFLKITAFASPCSHHPLELHLTRDNLSHFATDLNIPFEFNVLSLDPFDPSVLLSICAGVDEAVAVNLPAGSAYNLPAVPALLHLVKQLSPKIVVSVDHGCDRSDLSFSHQFLHAFQSSTVLLDSIDATGTDVDVANKIERFLLQPRIERALLCRHRAAANKMLPSRSLYASAGFVPVQFSNFTETQAECLLKRVQVKGFHVEKRQASLFLCWQRGELVSVSAWRC